MKAATSLVAAFAASQSSSPLIGGSGAATRSLQHSQLVAKVSSTVYQQAALGFFNGIRFPSTLVAGSSVAALFSLVEKARNPDGMTELEVALLRFYHVISLLQFCCSMTAIAMSTSASTLLLLTSKFSNTQYSDIYHFLRGDLNFEFVVTRWAFFSSLALFVMGVTSRVLLELNLAKPQRRTTGCLVALTMMGVLTGTLSNINLTLNCWPSLIGMTKEVLQVSTSFQTVPNRMICHFILPQASCYLDVAHGSTFPETSRSAAGRLTNMFRRVIGLHNKTWTSCGCQGQRSRSSIE